MRIAVNTRFITGASRAKQDYFITEIFKRVVINNKDHEFVFFADKESNMAFPVANNVQLINWDSVKENPFYCTLWFEVKLPYLLKKHKIDVLVSANGFCSLSTKIPQCLIIPHLDFLNYPENFNRMNLLFLKRNTKRALKIAKTVVTISGFLKKEMLKKYQLDAEKISLIHAAVAKNFQPVEFSVKQSMKEKYSDAAGYFIYKGDLFPYQHMLNLLKAFSVFKKRQKSNMKLVLAGKTNKQSNSLPEILKTYKFRNDIILLENIDHSEMAKVVASAYAFINPSVNDGYNIHVIEAMACGVPVITSIADEIDADAALFASAEKIDEMAAQMMLIYKDENRRNEVIKKGLLLTKQFNWNKSAKMLWQSIEKTIS